MNMSLTKALNSELFCKLNAENFALLLYSMIEVPVLIHLTNIILFIINNNNRVNVIMHQGQGRGASKDNRLCCLPLREGSNLCYRCCWRHRSNCVWWRTRWQHSWSVYLATFSMLLLLFTNLPFLLLIAIVEHRVNTLITCSTICDCVYASRNYIFSVRFSAVIKWLTECLYTLARRCTKGGQI